MSQDSTDFSTSPLRPLQLEIAFLTRRLERVEKHLLLTPLATAAAPSDAVESTSPAPPIVTESIPAAPIAAAPIAAAPIAAAPIAAAPIAAASQQLLESVAPKTPVESAPLPDVLVPSWVPETPAVTEPISTQQRAKSAVAPSGKRGWAEWENVVGGQWALWAGVASLFLALALFLAYTWTQLPPTPPWARVMMGVGGGLALAGASEWARTRARRDFSEGLCGAGLAMVYLSLWAGAQTLNVLPLGLAFGAMALTSALGTILALRYDAQRLLVLATIGGFCTPLLLQSSPGATSNLNLLIYVAVLDAGIVAAAVWKRWHTATWLSFIATTLLVGGWSALQVLAGRELLVWAFCTLYFVLFVSAALFFSLRRKEATAQADLLLLFGATTVYALGGFALLEALTRGFPATFALGLCAFLVAMSRAVGALAPENRTLRDSANGLAILFLTVAVPIQLQHSALAIGWSVEAAVLLILGGRLRGQLLGRAGQIVWLLSLFPLLGVLGEAPRGLLGMGAIPWLNGRALTLIFAICATFAVAWHRHRASEKLPDELANFYSIAAILGSAWLWAQEIHFALMPVGNGAPTSAVLFAVSMAWSVLSVAFFALGLKTRWLEMRAGALMVAALAWCLPLWTSLAHTGGSMVPFWNERALAFGLVAFNLGVLGALIRREKDAFSPGEARTLGEAPVWVALFVLLGATLEIWFAFAQRGVGDGSGAEWAAIAMLWAVFSVLLIALGNSWRHSSLRAMALPVGALSFVGVLASSLLIETQAPLWNWRALAFMVVCLSLLVSGAQWQRGEKPGENRDDALDLGAFIALACGILALWGGTVEIFSAVQWYRASLGNSASYYAPLASVMWWLSIALVWIYSGARRDFPTVRSAGFLVGALGLAWLLWAGAEASRTAWLPFLNLRLVAFVWAAGAMMLALQVLARFDERLNKSERDLMGALGLCAVGVFWWGLTREVWETAWYFRPVLGQNWERTAQMGISLWWASSGAGLLSAGIAKGRSAWRLGGLALLALTTLKLFGFDLSYLQGVSRILSLGGVGLALLFISWLYSRYGTDVKSTDGKSDVKADAPIVANE